MFQSVGHLPMSRLRPSLREKIKVRAVQEFLSRHLLEHGWKPGRGSIVREVVDQFGVDRDEARDLVDSYYGEVTETAQDWFEKESMSREERIIARRKEMEENRLIADALERLKQQRQKKADEEFLAWQKLQEPLLPKVPAKPACASDDDYEYQPHHINIRQVCSTRGWIY